MDIFELATKANEVCENTNSHRRFWIQGERYFICNSINTMDDIDEVTEEQFISRINNLIKNYDI